MTVTQDLTIELDGSLAQISAELDAEIERPRDVTLNTSQLQTQARQAAAAASRGFGNVFDDKVIKARFDDSDADPFFDRVADLEQPITTRFELIGEEQAAELFRLVQRIDNEVLDLDVEASPEKLQEILGLAEQINTFKAFVDIEAQTQEVQDALDLTEQLERVESIVNIQARDQALRDALDFAEDLDKSRQTRVDVDDSELQDAVQTAEELNQKKIRPEIEVENLTETQQLLRELPDLLNFSGAGQGLLNSLSGALGLSGAGLAASGGVLALGVGAAALFVQGFQQGLDNSSERLNIAINTGLSDLDLAATSSAAADAWALGYGTSLLDNERLAAATEEALGDVDPELDLTSTLRQLAILERQGIDTNRAILLTQRNINNGLVENTADSLDLLIAVRQEAGSSTDEVLDSLQEFGPFFARLGAEGPAAVGLIIEAWEQGLLPNFDRGAELIEEFIVEITSGAPEASRVAQELGLDIGELQDQIARGEGTQALADVSNALLTTGTSAEQASNGLAFFRTAFEGAADPQDALDLIQVFAEGGGSLTDFAETAQATTDRVANDISTSLAAYQNQWDLALSEVSDGIVETFATGDSAALEESAQEIGRLAGEALATGLTEVLPVAIGTALSEFVPSLIDGVVPEFRVLGLNLGDAISGGVQFGIGGGGGGFLGIFRDEVQELNADIADGANLLDVSEIADGSDDAVDRLEDITDASGDTRNSLIEIQEEINALAQTINTGFDFDADSLFRDVVEQTEAWVDAFAELGRASVDSAGNIDISTQAGRDFQEELEGANSVLQGLVQGVADGDLSFAEFAERQQDLANGFATIAAQEGLTEAATDALIAKYLQIPTELATELRLQSQEAEDSLTGIENRTQALEENPIEVDVFANDLASAEIDRIARNRTSTISFRGVLDRIAAAQSNAAQDGLIVGGGGTLFMADGGHLSGIAQPRPGGHLGLFNRQFVNFAENGREELFVNAGSSDARKSELVNRFDGGRLAQLIRQDSGGGGGDHIEHHWNVSSPIPDAVLAGGDLARQIAGIVQRANRADRRQRRTWQPG